MNTMAFLGLLGMIAMQIGVLYFIVSLQSEKRLKNMMRTGTESRTEISLFGDIG